MGLDYMLEDPLRNPQKVKGPHGLSQLVDGTPSKAPLQIFRICLLFLFLTIVPKLTML